MLEAVLSRAPPSERKRTFMVYRGERVSLEEAAERARRDPEFAEALRRHVEWLASHRSELGEYEWELALRRLEEMPEDVGVAVLAPQPIGGAYTKRDLIEHVKRRTPLGRLLVEAEMRYLRWLVAGR